ncbi:glycosyltransferase family 4 protein [Arthrobacter sp. AOP36-A1-22]|uniref:glycosyltransferase family 4 protein n=1 Tax=Arthrobacter sp. AOP36-A1-22 TaxID=3457684 RepID=UPI004034F3A6
MISFEDGLPSIEVVYPASKDHREWQRKHALNEVPDAWPYGLNRLSKYVNRLNARAIDPPSILEKVRLVVDSSMRQHGTQSSSGVAIAWDENAALRQYARRRPNQNLFAGIIWATDEHARGNSMRNRTIRKVLQNFSGLWCLSRPQVEAAQDYIGDKVPVFYLPFGIDEEFFSPLPESDEYPDRNRPLLFSAGGDRDRDPDTLMEALRIIHKDRPDVEIVVQSRLALSPVKGVEIVEHMPHGALRDYYRRASAVVLATKPNLHASGMTVSLESASCRTPVVATDTPGMNEYVLHDKTGYLVPPESPQALAERTLSVLNELDLAAAMGRAAREHVLSNHTTDKMVRELLKKIREIV